MSLEIISARARRIAKKALVIRIIATEDEQNKQDLKDFEKKDVDICRIPAEKRGRLRYFVNDKRFCLFVRPRSDRDDFFGVIGTDKLMVSRLKGLFETEYEEFTQ